MAKRQQAQHSGAVIVEKINQYLDEIERILRHPLALSELDIAQLNKKSRSLCIPYNCLQSKQNYPTWGSFHMVSVFFTMAKNPKRPLLQRSACGLMVGLGLTYGVTTSAPLFWLANIADLVAYSPARTIYERKYANIENRARRSILKRVLRSMDAFFSNHLYALIKDHGHIYNATCQVIRPEVLAMRDTMLRLLSPYLSNLSSPKSEHWDITHDLNVSSLPYKRLMNHLSNLNQGYSYKALISKTKINGDYEDYEITPSIVESKDRELLTYF